MENLPVLEEWHDGTQRVLSNGMTLWAKSWPSAKTYGMFVGVRVGSMEDPLDRPGCAHYLEHIPFRGAGRFASNLTIVDPIEEHGGECNANTGVHVTLYEITADPETFDHALDVLFAAVTEPRCTGVDTERATILREYGMHWADPWCRVHEEFPALFYANPSLGRSVIGTRESIKTMRAEHLAAFHAQWYSPDRMVATLVGPSSESALLDALEARFGRMPGRDDGHVGAPLAGEPMVRPGTRIFSWDIAETMLQCVGIFPAGERPTAVAQVFCAMLGNGASSPISQRLREEKGFCYTYDMGWEMRRGFGVVGFLSHTAAAQAAAYWDDFWHLVSPGAGLGTRRWEWAQCSIAASHRHAPFMPQVVAESAAEDLLTFGRVITRNEHAAEIRRASRDAVVAFAHQYFQPEVCLQVTFGP